MLFWTSPCLYFTKLPENSRCSRSKAPGSYSGAGGTFIDKLLLFYAMREEAGQQEDPLQ